jgi:hypothetical protein
VAGGWFLLVDGLDCGACSTVKVSGCVGYAIELAFVVGFSVLTRVGHRLKQMHGSFVGSPWLCQGLRCLRMTVGEGLRRLRMTVGEELRCLRMTVGEELRCLRMTVGGGWGWIPGQPSRYRDACGRKKMNSGAPASSSAGLHGTTKSRPTASGWGGAESR